MSAPFSSGAAPRPPERQVIRSPIQAIIADMAAKYGVTVADILSMRRRRPLPAARQEGYWRAYNETQATLPQIARAFHRADHSTIWYGVRAYAKRHGLPAAPGGAPLSEDGRANGAA